MTHWLLTISNKQANSWQMIKNGELSSTAEKPNLKRSDKLYVSVPGELVCSFEKQLPPLPKKNQQQTIGYAIEDHIASSLESVTICSQQDRKTGQTAILWCDQTQLQSWQIILNEHTTVPAIAVLPDYLYLPIDEASWTISQQHDHLLIRTSTTTGLTLRVENFLQTLPLLLQESAQGLQSIIYDSIDYRDSLEIICRKYGISLIFKDPLPFCYPEQRLPSLIKAKNSLSLDKTSFLKKINKTLATIWFLVLLAGVTGYYTSHPSLLTTNRARTGIESDSNKDNNNSVERKIAMHARGNRPQH